MPSASSIHSFQPEISIVTSAYRSAPFLERFLVETEHAVLKAGFNDYEIIVVNDGSPDESLDILLKAKQQNPRVRIVDLSRNFGHHKAFIAGLSHSRGALVFLIDSDLEVSPFELRRFVITLNDTRSDVVYGAQTRRKGGAVERIGGGLFWVIFNWLSDIHIPENILTERLLTRRYVDALLTLGDKNVFLGGMMYWAGFRQVGISIEKTQRDGRSSYSFWHRIQLLIEAITSFSTVPLQLMLTFGLLVTLIDVFAGSALLIRKLLYPDLVLAGYTTVVLAILGMGGVIITMLGVLGLYISKIFIQTQGRPLFIVKKFYD